MTVSSFNADAWLRRRLTPAHRAKVGRATAKRAAPPEIVERDRATLALHEQGLSYQKIADMHGVTRMVIAGRIKRARARE